MDITKEPPVREPARQYYYMEKCRMLLRQLEAKQGRALRCFVKTYGCQMNAKDSEKLLGILSHIGYQPSDEEGAADFVLYNTCTVRENANLKVYGHLGYLQTVK